MRMAADELLFAVHLPRRFAQHRQYLRKVGTRRAMAISKVALAGTALLEDGVVREIRLARRALRPFRRGSIKPKRCCLVSRFHRVGFKRRDNTLLAEAKPIDDIRSTAEYRRRVGANLLEEFLLELSSEEVRQ